MATRQEISRTYDWVDELFRRAVGDHGDYSCAFFDGDFSKSLEQAQADKHEHILRGIGFAPGHRILDVGCGWGPVLKTVNDRGGKAVGLTLSAAQARWCRQKGLEVYLQDYKAADPKTLGMFDGVVSVGAFEHFCSITEFQVGKQEEIYRAFFKFCAAVLPERGKMYLQTMTWGKYVPDPALITRQHPRGSDDFHLLMASYFYPGSWLPAGLDQIRACAEPCFQLISSNNGRLDYLKTIEEWGKRSDGLPSWGVAVAKLKLLPRLLFDLQFRRQMRFIDNDSQVQLFKRNLFSHERIIFQKR